MQRKNENAADAPKSKFAPFENPKFVPPVPMYNETLALYASISRNEAATKADEVLAMVSP